MTDVLTQLRTQAMPQVFGTLANAGVIEKMTVKRRTFTDDGAGGRTETGTTDYATDIGVKVVIDKKGNRYDMTGKLIAKQTYLLTFPPYWNGSQLSIALDMDYFVTDEHGSEPAKTYHIEAPAQGVLNEFICTKLD